MTRPRTNEHDLDAPPESFPFPSEAAAMLKGGLRQTPTLTLADDDSETAHTTDLGEEALAALENVSRRIEDLAREFNLDYCAADQFGENEGDDEPPRAA